MLFKIGVLKSLANVTEKYPCWSLFSKNFLAEGLQLYLKKTPTQVFSCEASASPVAASALI